METKKKMTEDECRQHQHFVIEQWKKNIEDAKADLEKRIKTPEYQELLKRLKEANARRGITIPGKI